MLGHRQAQRRQVEHLPSHDPDHHRIGQLAAAPLAAVRHMPDHLVRQGDLGQMGTGRAGLLAGRTAALGPLATTLPGLRGLSKTVRGRWLGGVRGVLSQAALQLCHAGRKLGVGRHQPGVGLSQLVDHHRLDRDGGLKIGIGGRDRGLLDNERSSPLAHGPAGQLHQRPPHGQTGRNAAVP
jgi:hypothetical protein